MYLNIIDIIDKGGHISAWPAKRKMQMNLTWHNQLLWLDFVVDDNALLAQLFTSWRKTVKVPEYRHFSSCQPRNESLLKEEDVVDLCRRCNYFWKGTSKQNSGRFTKLWETFVMKPFCTSILAAALYAEMDMNKRKLYEWHVFCTRKLKKCQYYTYNQSYIWILKSNSYYRQYRFDKNS